MVARSIIIWTVLLLCIAGIAFSIPHILRYVLASEEPIMTIVSRSMWPALNRGDIVFVKEASPEDIQVGTVVVFRNEERLVVHRVVKVNDKSIVTKGDANTEEDRPIAYEDVIGRVTTVGGSLFKVPYIGLLGLVFNPESEVGLDGEPGSEASEEVSGAMRYFTNPVVIAILILFPVIIIISSVISYIRQRLSPNRHRERLLRERLRRLEARWGKDRAQRAFAR